MSAVDRWQAEVPESFAAFAGLGADGLDPTYGRLAAAVLWPVRDAPVDDEMRAVLRAVCGERTPLVLRALRGWSDDRLAAAWALAAQARADAELGAALDALLVHFLDVLVGERVVQPAPAGIDARGVAGAIVGIGGAQYFFGPVTAKHTIVQTEEQAYHVAGLLNPYLGLEPYDYKHSNIFAGRERIVRTLADRLDAPDGDRLLLIVGASGSGKSSLARAGLLPALTERLRAHGHAVQTHIIDHPGGGRPSTELARVLQEVLVPDASPATPPRLVLIDQFEELFAHPEPDESARALEWLAHAAQSALPLRIIATMRSDFLPHLVADRRFETAARRKVVLRAMSVEELKDAIVRPIQVLYPEKRIEPALVQRLATDAAVDATYLPLLQVTLEDLWRGGDLRLGAYQGLADAIQRRADAVYAYRDYDGLQQERRTPAEQSTIVRLFLDLVRVSLNDEQRDVRWRRSRVDLTRNERQREQLIADLVSARLLRTDRDLWPEDGRDQQGETVDIVHEALLSGWTTLKDAIDNNRGLLRQRVRFDLALGVWREKAHSNDYLLTGVWLNEAMGLDIQRDITVQSMAARDLLARSIARREAERRNMVMLRSFLLLTSLLLIITFASIGFAFLSGQAAAEQAKRDAADIKDAQLIASQAQAEFVVDKVDPATKHVLESIRKPEYAELPVIATALRRVYEKIAQGQTLSNSDQVVSVAWSPDGKYILTGSGNILTGSGMGRNLFNATIWNGKTGGQVKVLQGHSQSVWSVAWSPTRNQVLTGSWDNTVRVWDVTPDTWDVSPDQPKMQLDLKTGAQVRESDMRNQVWSVAWSPDGREILVGMWSGFVHIYDAETGERRADLGCRRTDSDDQAVLSVAWKPDGKQIAVGRKDGYVCIWDAYSETEIVNFKAAGIEVRSVAWNKYPGTMLLTTSIDNLASTWDATNGQHLRTFIGHTAPVRSAAWSPNGDKIVTGSSDRTARIWDVETGREISILLGHVGDVWSVAWHPTKPLVLTGSYDGAARVWLADGQLMAAKLTMIACERFGDKGIRADIPTWRGCDVAKQVMGEKIRAFIDLGLDP